MPRTTARARLNVRFQRSRPSPIRGVDAGRGGGDGGWSRCGGSRERERGIDKMGHHLDRVPLNRALHHDVRLEELLTGRRDRRKQRLQLVDRHRSEPKIAELFECCEAAAVKRKPRYPSP